MSSVSRQIASLKERVRANDEKSRAAASELRDLARSLAARDEEVAQLRQAGAMLDEVREANSRLEDEKDQLSEQVPNIFDQF